MTNLNDKDKICSLIDDCFCAPRLFLMCTREADCVPGEVCVGDSGVDNFFCISLRAVKLREIESFVFDPVPPEFLD